jgi:hypothetical protein
MPLVHVGSIVLDCPDPLALPSFYAKLLGWSPDPEPVPDNHWAALSNPAGGVKLAFQRITGFRPPTWPQAERPQMLHLDLKVADLDAEHERCGSGPASCLTRRLIFAWMPIRPARSACANAEAGRALAGRDLTPVMARLGPADLETLDALITAGIASSRAEAVRWALARIRERPAYAQLRERAREIDRLKTEF